MARFPFSFSLFFRGWKPGRGFLSVLVLMSILMPATGQAVLVENLYRAEIPVEDTGQAARDEAVRKGLAKVLVRVTGTRSVLEREGMEALLDEAPRLVDSYRYQQRDEDLLLQVQLNAAGISRELAQRDIPVWGANRPGILVWFVVSDRTGRELVHREYQIPPFLEEARRPVEAPHPTEQSGWKASLYQQSSARGVPLLLPWYDERDQETVGLSELWGLFRDPIEEASSRYSPDRVAIVRVNERGGQWQARWQIGPPGESEEDGSLTAEDEETLVAELIDQWAEHYSRLFAVSPAAMGDPQRLDMIVEGVDSMPAYAAVRRALQTMEPVRSAEPEGVSRDQLRLRLQFSGDVAVLREYVALDHRFRPVGEEPAIEEPGRFDPLPSEWRIDGVGVEEAGSDEERFAGLYPRLRYEWRPDDEEDEKIEAVEMPEPEETVELIDLDGEGSEF